MNGVAGLNGTAGRLPLLAEPAVQQLADANLEVKEKFQEFVAGTFYSQMLKSLHKTHDKPAYFHGGQTEEIFQSHLDQQVASDLAKNNGAGFSDSLFEAFLHQPPK
jgi:Rod binding domain-containing protein